MRRREEVGRPVEADRKDQRFYRTKLPYRHEGDGAEVRIEMSAQEAYDLALVLSLAGVPNGRMLQAFLEDTERGAGTFVNRRDSASIEPDRDVVAALRAAVARVRNPAAPAPRPRRNSPRRANGSTAR